MVDFLLGEESTANETFSATEQTIISNYLDNGGKLFVSGAEIGWDLYHLGNSSDSIFYTNYLKAKYIYDAPNNQSGTYYDIESINGSIFNGIDPMQFDDGTNGIYNVVYPDVIEAVNGSTNSLAYSNLSNNFAAINYHGLFPNGTVMGKLVYVGFPFETIVSAQDRDTVMSRILTYFMDIPSTASINNELEQSIKLYPNPVSEKLTIELNNKDNSMVKVELYNGIGELVFQTKTTSNLFQMDLTGFVNGIYFLSVVKDHFNYKEKIIKY